MKYPHNRINENIEETNKIIDKTKETLTQLGIADYIQSLQISSFEQRLKDLKGPYQRPDINQ